MAATGSPSAPPMPCCASGSPRSSACEEVALADAAGRCLAAPLVSPRDVPAFDNAAVDGFAFAFAAACARPARRLTLLPGPGRGRPSLLAARCRAGAALRVLTGAVMPEGADTVALQEEAVDRWRYRDHPARAQAPAPTAAVPARTCRAGQPVLATGIRLRPQEIGLAAELGLGALPVFARLRVALLSTGDELIEPGRGSRCWRRLRRQPPDPPGACCDRCRSRSPTSASHATMPARSGAPSPPPPPTHHVLLTSGGASRGDEDHVVRTVAADGRLDFWQIAMKPGRPLAFGRLGEAVFVGPARQSGRDHGLLPAVRAAGADAPGRLRLAHAHGHAGAGRFRA